jgi:aldehyde dehydrogenase (NAD+)
LNVENPSTGESLGVISAASPEDVNKAVESATIGFKTWKNTPGPARAKLLLKLADLIERDADDFASLEAVDAGVLYTDSKGMNIPQAVGNLRYYAGWADKIDGKTLAMEGGVAFTYREPLGVCGAIVPWNAPLYVAPTNKSEGLLDGYDIVDMCQ